MAQGDTGLGVESMARFKRSLVGQLQAHSDFKDRAGQIDAARISVVVEARPIYLRDGACKLRARLELDDFSWEALCLYCEEGEYAIACGFLSGQSLPAVLTTVLVSENSEAPKGTRSIRDFLDIGEAEKVSAYFTDFVEFAESGIRALARSSHAQTNVQWFSPLLPEEIERLDRALMNSRPAARIHTEQEFQLEANLLDRDKLRRCIYTVYTADKHGLAQSTKWCGQIERVDVLDPLLEGFPDNYRVMPGTTLGFPFQERRTDGRIDVSAEESTLIKRDLDRHVHLRYDWPDMPLWCAISQVRMQRSGLGYGDLELLEIRPAAEGDKRSAYVLWRPGYAQMLNGTSGPIHQANDDIAWMRSARGEAPDVIRSPQEALEYVRFFCSHCWGDGGPFTIVETRLDSILKRISFDKAEWAKRFASADEVLDAIEPLRCELTARSDSPGEYEISGFVLYDTVIFAVRFKLQRNGLIAMIEDEPRLAGQLATGCKPFDKKEQYSIGEVHVSSLHDDRRRGGCLSRESCAGEEDGTHQYKTFIGTLRARDTNVRTFRNCRFRGLVDFSGLRTSQPLVFDQCTFEAGLRLVDARLDGMLSMQGCVVLQGADADVALSAMGLRASVVNLFSVYASTGISMSHGLIELRFYVWKVRTEFARGADMDLYGLTVEHGYIGLRNIQVGGGVDATFARAGTLIVIDTDLEANNVVGKSCELGGAIAPQGTRVLSTTIGGDLELKGLHSSALSIRPTRLENSEAQEIAAIRISGTINLNYCVIDDEIAIVNVKAGPDSAVAIPAEYEIPTLTMRHANVGGDIHFFLDRRLARVHGKDMAPLQKPYVCEFTRGIDLSNSTIEGDLNLSGVRTQGPINLDDTSITCDLLLSKRADANNATAKSLSMNSLCCRGHVDLSGLSIEGSGKVFARFAECQKSLSIATSAVDAARIEGGVDLTNSELGELKISVRTFWPDRNVVREGTDWRGIVLEQAKIGKLTVHHEGNRYPRPIGLRNAKIQSWEFFGGDGVGKSDDVKQYQRLLRGDPNRQLHTYRSIEQNLASRGHEDAADKVYWEMRKWQFYSKVGDLIDWLKPRAGRSLLATIRFVLSWPFRVVLAGIWFVVQCLVFAVWTFPTSYKITPVHLLVTIAVWLGVSSTIFSIASNIAPSEEQPANPAAVAGQPPKSWTPKDGVWMALRYHVPIVLFTARNEWEPTNERPLALPMTAKQVGWLNPEDYANIVLVLHWLWWPIVLISSSRKYFRRSDR